MNVKRMLAAVLTLLLLCLAGAALAAEAEDLTRECTFKGSEKNKIKLMWDDRYPTCWRSQGGSAGRLTVTLPEGKKAHGIYIKWYDSVTRCQIMEPQGDDWMPLIQSEGQYLAEYIPFPKGLSSFRLAVAKGVKGRMNIAELRVFGEGEIPRWVQRWEPPAEKTDLMVVVAHPDDELLFMGGAIPYYAGGMGKKVQVVYMTKSMPYRRLELLDGLWLCGVRQYPHIGPMRDSFSTSRDKMYKTWGKDRTIRLLAEAYRRYRPDVVVTHDFDGEYGHGAHKVTADACVQALERAADAQYHQESFEKYGAWDVKKLYVHLYDQNVVDMDWRRPLQAFGGKTAFEMAQEGFKCHRSQQNTEYVVEDFGPYDNSLFGLYRSLVGADTGLNDFFENIAQ